MSINVCSFCLSVGIYIWSILYDTIYSGGTFSFLNFLTENVNVLDLENLLCKQRTLLFGNSYSLIVEAVSHWKINLMQCYIK